MEAGKLRHKLFVWQPVDSLTSRGDDEITYTAGTPRYVYGSVEPLVGRELLFAMQLRADISHKITLRFIPATFTHRTQLRWHNGTKFVEYNLGPPLSKENRNIELGFYAIEIN